MKLTTAILLLVLATAVPKCVLANWKAGLAKTDITPEGPIWLAGFGARTKPSEGVLQSIYV